MKEGTFDNRLISIVSNSHFVWETACSPGLITFGFHGGPLVNENVSLYDTFVHSWAAKPSPGLFFGILVLPCG